MTLMTLELHHWQAKLLIEACQELERRWTGIVYTTKDENEQADYGNDLADLKIVQSELAKSATEAFGDHIMVLSREPIPQSNET